VNTGAGKRDRDLHPGFVHQDFYRTVEVKDMVNVSKEGQIFKCEICGNVVVVKEAGGGELVCCGEPMVLEE
jgi:desulfoferrodoxin-like iron-binding protein